MGLRGVILARHILPHPWQVSREFGWRVYWRAWKFSFQPGTHTFLDCIK